MQITKNQVVVALVKLLVFFWSFNGLHSDVNNHCFYVGVPQFFRVFQPHYLGQNGPHLVKNLVAIAFGNSVRKPQTQKGWVLP